MVTGDVRSSSVMLVDALKQKQKRCYSPPPVPPLPPLAPQFSSGKLERVCECLEPEHCCGWPAKVGGPSPSPLLPVQALKTWPCLKFHWDLFCAETLL